MQIPQMQTRRDLGRLALAAVPVLNAMAKVPRRLHGVQFGVAGFSYNTLPRTGLLDVIVQSMVDFGIGDCLLYAPSTEPVELLDKARPARGGTVGIGRVGGSGGQGRAGGGSGGQGRGPGGGGAGRGPVNPEQAAALEALRQWHLTVPLSYYTAIRKKFSDAGLTIDSYDAALGNTTSDDDLNRACEATRALSAHFMMCVVSKSVAKRLAPIAEKHNVKVGFQGRPNMNSTDPDAMAKPSDFEEALGYSKNFGTSVDVGDATGGGWDAMKFLQDTHPRIFALNLKDRNKANVSLPWGQGDSRIKEILQFVRDRKYPIRCYINCEYATADGTTRLADIKRCMDFARNALA